MSEWKKVTLGELIDSGECAIYDNLRKPLSKIERNKMKYGNLYPYYGAAGVIDFINNYCFDGYYLLIAEDGTITSDGTKPMLQLANGKFWVSNHAHVLQCKNEWKTKFLYYALLNVDINPYITGSVQPKLNQENLFSIPLLIPKSELEQRAIASVLSSIDDKIDLLHRENKTLEAMAETLFKKLFIKEARDYWQKVPLSDVVNITIGKTPPREESHWFSTDPQNIKWTSIKDLGHSDVFVFDTSEYLTLEAVEKFKIPIIPADTVLLSFKLTVGRVRITGEAMASNEAIAHFKFNDKTPFSKEYLYLFLKRLKYESLGNTSSIATAINSSLIKNIEITIPDNITMSIFRKNTEPLFAKIKENEKQIRTLTQLRDTLLPKLMSGEVRVDLCQS